MIRHTPLDKAKSALDDAKGELARLATASDLETLRSAFLAFTAHLRTSWNKLDVLADDTGGAFLAWKNDRFAEVRRDSLLLYLWETRNVGEHSNNEVLRVQVESVWFAGPSRIQSIRLVPSRDGGMQVLDYEGTAPVRTDGRYELLELVTERGRKVPPPVTHLGLRIAELTLPDQAAIAFKFYDDMVQRADEAFFPRATMPKH